MSRFSPWSLGPITSDDMLAAIAAPAGGAAKIIRKSDPMWGREPGEEIEWRVRLRAKRPLSGTVIVSATSAKEAMQRAEDLDSWAIDWDDGDETDIEAIEARPHGTPATPPKNNLPPLPFGDSP